MNLKIQVKKLSDLAIIPTKGTDHAAGYDLYSTEDYILDTGERHLFKTNISLKLPKGYYGRIAGRSGLAYKVGISVLAGVIDSDYTGDIGAILLNTDNNKTLGVKKGDKIAQIIFEKHYDAEFEEVEELELTNRGEKGFGSTDKKGITLNTKELPILHPYNFKLSDTEVNAFLKFKKEQCEKYNKTFGDINFKFQFELNGIGMSTEILNKVTGDTKNITDYTLW